MVSWLRLLFALLTAAAVAIGAFAALNLGGGVTGVSALTPTPTYTPIPTPGPASFSVDAIPGGPIDTTRSVPVGTNFSVDVVLDAYGPPWAAYAILLDYFDPVLDATGIPPNWADPPVTNVSGGNLIPFPNGGSCATENSVFDENDLGPASVSMDCSDSVLGGTTTATGPLVQLVFTCESPGTSLLSLAFTNSTLTRYTLLVDDGFNTIYPQMHNATITCVDGPFASFSVDAIPGGGIDAARTVTTGTNFSVDIVLDEYAGEPWTAYQVTLDYEDPVLDPLFPTAWENPPVIDMAGGNLYSFLPYGPACAPTNPANSSGGTEDDIGFAVLSMACLHDAVGSPLPTTSFVGPLVQLAFRCERPGIATLDLRGIVDTFMLGPDPNFNTYNDEQHNATIACVGASPASIEKVPFGNANNVVPGDLPLANLWLCEPDDDPANDPDCDGSGEGRLTFSERATTIDTPLGAFEFQVKFDHKIFDINVECVTEADPDPGCTLADTATWDIFLGAFLIDGTDMGREWGMDQCFLNVTENYINFACTSTGPPDAGRTGSFEIAIVRLHPDADLKFRLTPGNDNGVVRVILDENCELADPLGHAVEGSIAGGLTPICGDLAVTVRILEGDVDLDCDVDVADAQAIAQRYGMVLGLFLYDPWYDLEPNIKDFDIDAKDLQKVFGRIGSTCQNPIPPQPPIAPPQA